jgi:hypothetical protein
VIEEAAGEEFQPVTDVDCSDVLLEDGGDLRQIETYALQMRIGARDLRGEISVAARCAVPRSDGASRP